MNVGLAALFALFALFACGTPPPPPQAPPPPVVVAPAPEPNPEQKAAAEAIEKFYKVLTVESAVPGDPELVREAAIEALAPRGWKAAPIAWTNKIDQDAALLRGAVHTLALRGELPADPVMRVARAMAAAVKDTHTFALPKASLDALFALIAGGPVVQAGLLFHKVDDGRFAVSDVLPGGAAQAAGVQRGDIVVSIDENPIVQGFLDFAPYLGVAEGTIAKLVVERGGQNQEIVLGLVPVASPIVEWRILPGGIGYLRIWACTHSDDPTKDAALLVADALAGLDKKRVKKLVVDLRGNPGGFPFDIASLFVAADPLLVAVGADAARAPVPRTAVTAWKTKYSLAVIVDEQTISGGEMVALVLKDHAGAKIVGRPTAGGLSFPNVEMHKGAPDVALSYPVTRVSSATTKTMFDGNRLIPDVDARNPTTADFTARKDPQLDAAVAALKKR